MIDTIFLCSECLMSSAVLIYGLWAREQTAAQLYTQRKDLSRLNKKLVSRRKSDHVTNHSIKNILAETYSTLLLYFESKANRTDLLVSAKQLQRGLRFMKSTLDLATMFDGTFTSKPSVIADMLSWVKQHATQTVDVEAPAGAFEIAEGLIAELYLDLTFGNAMAHGVGDVRVECSFDETSLHIDIHNAVGTREAVGSASNHMKLFSTGRGLDDLKQVCALRGIRFSAAPQLDGRWHCKICLGAVAMDPPAVRHGNSAVSPHLPHGLQISIVDDQASHAPTSYPYPSLLVMVLAAIMPFLRPLTCRWLACLYVPLSSGHAPCAPPYQSWPYITSPPFNGRAVFAPRSA